MKPRLNDYLKAIEDSQGVLETVAKRLGITRDGVSKFAHRHPRVMDAIYDERERMKDYAESKLYGHIQDGNLTALIFYLKTQGHDRGYIERLRLEGGVDIKLVNDMILAIRGMGQEPEDVMRRLIEAGHNVDAG